MKLAWWWKTQPGGLVEERVAADLEVGRQDGVRCRRTALLDDVAERLERGLDLRVELHLSVPCHHWL